MASKKPKEEKALETRGETAMQSFEYGADDIGAGFEHQTKADTTIPFVILLQALSPIISIEERDGVKAGMYFNTVTEEVWNRETGFLFVPATTRNFYAEWTPRIEGKSKFQGHHEIDSDEVRDAIAGAASFGKNKTKDGNDLVETFYVYGVICSEDGHAMSMSAMAFSSTKIRPYKAWMTRLSQFAVEGKRVPLYAHLTRFTSLQQKNEKGAFFVPAISSADPRGIRYSLLTQDDERFMMAKACRKLVDSGDARINPEQQASQGSGETETPF